MNSSDLVRITEAARIVGKTVHNIRYYIDYGRIGKYQPDGRPLKGKAKNSELRISLPELKTYLSLMQKGLSKHHKAGLDAELGFYNVPERERTKHVHRLHPYLGKFIPQLVEWFLTKHFEEDDIILDPFMGSGTALIQGNELKMHTIGIDISEFNCRIAKVKTQNYDISEVKHEIEKAERILTCFSERMTSNTPEQIKLFPEEQLEDLKRSLMSEVHSEYLRTWFAERTLYEIIYYRKIIREMQLQDLLQVLLSRAVRSSRLVPHYDLATPKFPLKPGKEYWCKKHNRYCKPIEQLLVKIHNYSMDTIRRINTFDKLRSNKHIRIIQGDSRYLDLEKELKNTSISKRKINGIFTSPPYVGQIDYHDQHIYAYELFDIPKNDEKEIGPKKNGKSREAKEKYTEDVAAVFLNVNKCLRKDAKIFIVANDRFKLYPEIAKRSGMKIIKEYHRAVTKRTEQGDNPYQETIFYMKTSSN